MVVGKTCNSKIYNNFSMCFDILSISNSYTSHVDSSSDIKSGKILRQFFKNISIMLQTIQ